MSENEGNETRLVRTQLVEFAFQPLTITTPAYPLNSVPKVITVKSKTTKICLDIVFTREAEIVLIGILPQNRTTV